MLKVDNRIVGRTHWRQLGTEPWDQSFSTDLERVSSVSSARLLHLLQSRPTTNTHLSLPLQQQTGSQELVLKTSLS